MSKKNNSTKPWKKALEFLGSFQIAIVCMLLLLILTWLATLEQTGSAGLYWTLKKYFSFDAWFIRPTINERDLFILLPGGYLVCAVFTLNLLCGGVLRARKGWKHAPLLVSHMSMTFLMIAGAVSYHKSEEAYILLKHGEVADHAFSLTEISIEVAEIKDGEKQAPTVISSELLEGVRGNPSSSRKFLLPNLPFDIEVYKFYVHAKPMKASATVEEKFEVVDGIFLAPKEPTGQEESNESACYISVIERSTGESTKLILMKRLGHDVTATVDGKVYGFRMDGEIMDLAYKVRLDDSRGEMHPGSGMASVYESDVTVLDEDGRDLRKVKIEMNLPLRHEGVTFYQTKWSNQGTETVSGFTVKINPSDQWPKFAIYLCGIALFFHFTMKLSSFVSNSIAKHKNEK